MSEATSMSLINYIPPFYTYEEMRVMIAAYRMGDCETVQDIQRKAVARLFRVPKMMNSGARNVCRPNQQ